MKPQDLIRAAAKLLEEKGWCQPPGQHAAAAADGTPVALWGNTKSTEAVDTSRATLNPRAATFSIYGAIAAAHLQAAEPLESGGLMWDVLYDLSVRELGDHAPGGTNYVHPILAYNNAEGRTKEEVLAFLQEVAIQIEIETTMDTTVVKA